MNTLGKALLITPIANAASKVYSWVSNKMFD